jgi:predicted aspartyl protease
VDRPEVGCATRSAETTEPALRPEEDEPRVAQGEEGGVHPQSPSSVVVCQIASVSQFTVGVQVGDRPVTAVVDTAAQVTIISDRVFQSLKHKPPTIRTVQLMAAGREMLMQGFVAGPVKLKIGNRWYQEEVYVAPIEQEMLLGFDLLRNRGQAILDMGRGLLLFDGMEISLNVDPHEGGYSVARVTVSKRRVIPPYSVAKIPCKLSEKLTDYVVEPIGSPKVVIPRVLRHGDSEPIVCVLNPSDRYRLLSKGMEIGRAFPVEEVIGDRDEPEPLLVREIKQVDSGKANPSLPCDVQLPNHLKQVYTDACNNLNQDQQIELARLLAEYQDVFASDDFDLGCFTAVEHEIETGGAKPVKQRMRRTPACFAGEEETHLEKMLKAGVIQESTSNWASAPVLIKKRDGSVRWCIDYRALNDVTVKDVFPLPLIDDCLDTVSGSIWFSKLDANSAYWQVKIREEDRPKTAFITRYGLFEHVRMGFGLCGAPATFARAMNLVLRGLTWKTVLAFLDDIIVLGTSFSEHMKNLQEALERFRQFGLKLKPRKCSLFQREVEFLGRKVSHNQVAMTEEDIAVVKAWPVPTCAKHVERFMGLANYHRGFIKDFSHLAAPLYAVTGKKQFVWEEEQIGAFSALKKALCEPPILALPNLEDTFVLDTDASDLAVGAVLSQIQGGQERVIAYGSYALTKEQRRYCVTRKELLAIVRFTRQFKHYLLGKPFVVRTDHSSLRWLMSFREPQGQLARWLEELSQYNMVLRYRAGRDHGNADALSRLPREEGCMDFRAGVRLGELPCGGCKYCTRAQDNWGAFLENVDDAVPLVAQSRDSTPLAMESSEIMSIQNIAVHGNTCGTSLHLDNSGKTASTTQLAGSSEEQLFGGPPLEYGTEIGVWDPGSPVDAKDVAALGTVLENILWGQEGVSEGIVMGVNVVTRGAAKAATEKAGMDEPDPASDVARTVQTNNSGGEGIDVASGQSEIKCLSSWGFSLEDLQAAQQKDENFVVVLAWLREGKEPDPSTLFHSSPSAKHYWLSRKQLSLIDGVVYREVEDSGEKRLLLPKSLQDQALHLNHNLPSMGHQGIQRTKERMKEKFSWYGMGNDIAGFVAGCATCNQNKKSTKTGKFPLTEYQAGAPMERVHIDFLGPLPRTPRGNEYVLMMVDQFTKWVECVPMPSQTAEATAKAAVDCFFSRFGMPFQIFSDQGRNFDSGLFTELCKVLHIHKARTTPYRPSSNGQVERYNSMLMDAVRCFIGKSQNQWDLHIQQIAAALRSSVNRMTGFTANKLMLGREVNTPADLMFPHQINQQSNRQNYVTKLTAVMQETHEVARSVMKTTSKRMKRNYDLRVLERNYQVGDVVYLLDTAVLKGQCKKLCPPWKGPAVIVHKLSDCLFRIKLRNAVFVANHDRLKPCRDRKIPQWIEHWKQSPEKSVATARGDDRIYCLCRQPWQGRFMIQCDHCGEWYHGACVDITATEAVNINRYCCSDCKARRQGLHI